MIVSNLGSFFLIVLVWFPKLVQRQILFQLCSGLDASIFLCIFAVCFPCSRNVVESAGACSRGVRPWLFAKGPFGRTYIMSWNLVHLYGAPWKTDLARSWSERVFGCKACQLMEFGGNSRISWHFVKRLSHFVDLHGLREVLRSCGVRRNSRISC